MLKTMMKMRGMMKMTNRSMDLQILGEKNDIQVVFKCQDVITSPRFF